MQAVLDTCLERASREVKVRFVALLELGGSKLIVEEVAADSGAVALARRPIRPLVARPRLRVSQPLRAPKRPSSRSLSPRNQTKKSIKRSLQRPKRSTLLHKRNLYVPTGPYPLMDGVRE